MRVPHPPVKGVTPPVKGVTPPKLLTPPSFPLCRYRARVERVESPAKVHIFYIDYGNVSAWGGGA